MPNRDYYLREGEQYDRYRAAYRDYVVSLHRLAGIADAEAKADAIIALERRIAEAHWTPERQRDIRQVYNPMNRAQLAALAPQFDWTATLQQLGLGEVPTIIAGETTAIAAIGAMLDTVPLQTWKDWMAFHFLNANAQYLPRAFDEANFNFFSRTLRGQERQRDRWKRGIGLLNNMMGEAVGKIYVERHFPAESRRQMNELIGNLRAAFEERLRRLDWMDEETRAQALAKLADLRAPHRPPRALHRLFVDPGRPGRPARQRHARRRVRLEPAGVAARRPGRPRPLGDEPADDQRPLRALHDRLDRLAGKVVDREQVAQTSQRAHGVSASSRSEMVTSSTPSSSSTRTLTRSSKAVGRFLPTKSGPDRAARGGRDRRARRARRAPACRSRTAPRSPRAPYGP